MTKIKQSKKEKAKQVQNYFVRQKQEHPNKQIKVIIHDIMGKTGYRSKKSIYNLLNNKV